MFYGIDTSCYTTSLAVVDDQGRLLCERRAMLEVEAGGRGLRQSEAVFRHVRTIPLLAREVGQVLAGRGLLAVAASTRPRPAAGSYMPVFTVGEAFARTLAETLGVPFHPISHQEGHILAGMWSAGVRWQSFLAVHMSGGTTEVLEVGVTASGMTVAQAGGTGDLHAGQFIDRAGVLLGLPFPAGPHLEKLAEGAAGEIPEIPASVSGTCVSFSGPESHIKRLLARDGWQPAVVARAVELCVARSLLGLVENVVAATGGERVLFVGGVAANRFIREHLARGLSVETAFADPAFTGDNAVGVALSAFYFCKNF